MSLPSDGFRYTQLNLSWAESCLLALLSKYICVLWRGVEGVQRQYFMTGSFGSALILLGELNSADGFIRERETQAFLTTIAIEMHRKTSQ